MSLKLIAVKNDPYLADTGSCELCYGSRWVDEPVYVFQDADTGETKHVNGYLWSWGDYFDLFIDSIPAFAEWVQRQPNLTLDQLNDYNDLQRLIDRMDDEEDE